MKLQFDLSNDLENHLNSVLSKMNNVSKEQLMTWALEQYLDDCDVLHDYEEQRRNGTLVTYSLEEVMKNCGITKDDLKNVD